MTTPDWCKRAAERIVSSVIHPSTVFMGEPPKQWRRQERDSANIIVEEMAKVKNLQSNRFTNDDYYNAAKRIVTLCDRSHKERRAIRFEDVITIIAEEAAKAESEKQERFDAMAYIIMETMPDTGYDPLPELCQKIKLMRQAGLYDDNGNIAKDITEASERHEERSK